MESTIKKANETFKQKNYEEAIEEYTKVLEYDPSNKNLIL